MKLAGATVQADGGRDMQGGGFGIQGTEDSLHFDYRPLSGDGQMVACVVMNEPARGLAKAGVMMRESLAPDAACAAVLVTPTNGIAFQWRERVGEPSELQSTPLRLIDSTNRFWRLTGTHAWQAVTTDANLVEPAEAKLAGKTYWVKLVRKGNVVSAYCSPTGRNWKWLGSEQVNLPRRVFVGPMVNSYDFNQRTSAHFTEVRVRSLPTPEETAAVAGSGTGLRGFYYGNTTSNTVIRLIPALDFNWTKRPPLPQVTQGNFTARWDGYVEAQHSEMYALEVVTQGGVRLWINNRKVIDDWVAPEKGVLRTLKALFRFEEGRKYHVRLEYATAANRSTLKLLWSSPSTPRQVIPQSQLYPPDWQKAQASAIPPVSVTADLPVPWARRDIGRSRQPGSAVQTSDGIYIEGNGFDIGGNADEFHYVFQPWTGDGEIVARVTGRLEGSPGAKAGVMIRENLAPDAANVSLTVTHPYGIRFEQRRRSSEDAETIDRAPQGDTWVKLSRRRSMFTAWTSRDGENWTWLAKTEVPMSANFYVGLALSSHKYTQRYGAHFEQVIVRGLQPGSRPLVGSGDGLGAVYYDLATSNSVARIDPTLNFAWGRQWPAEGISRAPFSARWQGLLEAQHSETYALHLISDGGVRLWLDGNMILDDWSPHARHEKKVRVSMLAGHRYALQAEYSSKNVGHVRLLWSGPSTPKRPIPQSQCYSPEHPSFKEIEDKDHDGMPDAWERLYGLNEFDASDAAADPDGDGLTNLQEYLAGTNPRKADTDGDGLPDGWEVKHGLNPLDPSDANKDLDHDGLTNLEEFRLGTNPTLEDTDGDGLPDGLELRETGTNPLVSDKLTLVTVAEVNGSDTLATLGRWAVDGDSIYAEEGRGQVEYVMAAPQADMYRLEVEGASQNPDDPRREFELMLWVDGEYLGRSVLDTGRGSPSVMHQFTPWLKAGEHRIRLFWDNANWNRALRLNAVRLQALQGADSNGNGIQDWVENRLHNTCTVDAAAASSAVSPICMEGQGTYLGMMTISGGITPQHGVGERWYADVPLSPTNRTEVVCSFQNGGLSVTNQIVWRPINVLDADNKTIRRGDSLLLVAKPAGAEKGQMQIAIVGVTNYSSSADQPIVHRFGESGVYSVTGTYVSKDGLPQTRTVTVEVKSASLGSTAAAWAGKWRRWEYGVPAGVAVQADPHLKLTTVTGATGSQTDLATDAPEQRFVLARVDNNGPVVASTSVDGFRLFSGYETGVWHVLTYEDGTELVEMGLVLSPVRPGVTVRVEVHAGGVVFDDGTTIRELTAADFDELGRVKVRFLRPPAWKTSVCHRTQAYQDGVFLGTYP